MIQKIKLNKGQSVKRSDVINTLLKAKSTYDYAQYTLYNNKYLTVSFLKDNRYEISTDCREQYQLFYDIKVLKSIDSFYSLVDFMTKWLNKLNK